MRVADQVGEIARMGRLRRFLPPARLSISHRRIMRRHEAECVVGPAIDISKLGVAPLPALDRRGISRHRLHTFETPVAYVYFESESARTIQHRPRIHLTIRQRTRVLQKHPPQ
jgi:hypothetical protein